MVLAWYFSGLAAAVAETPKTGADGGSLVLESSKETRKGKASGDTLYDLLGHEVQVYVFNKKTRVWPKTMVRSGPWAYQPAHLYRSSYAYRGAWSGSRDPRVDGLINKYSLAYGVDPALVRAVVRNESGFNAGAVSPKGAQGLMQLMPGTAALMGVRDPFDPEQNIAGGVGYLRHCLDRFGQNVPLAVAAYNAGPEAVAKYSTIPPYQETQAFVSNVMGSYGAYSGKPVPNSPAVKNAPGVAGRKPPAKLAVPQQAENQEKDLNIPRRPKAKIIEVRTTRVKTKAITILRD
ncbi:MAG: lytic transglycosylase domain-containing protein [Deltaproteobacteria bacterium]|nr:lytic transglycosylase domain-containing protein [Deltaproteobacteria bacterium]